MLKKILFWFFWILAAVLLAVNLTGCSTDREVIYSTIYPNLNELQSPLILNTNACKWTYPIVQDDKVFIGLDEENFRCYIENQEIQREQRKLYENFVKQVNAERQKYSNLNKKLDK